LSSFFSTMFFGFSTAPPSSASEANGGATATAANGRRSGSRNSARNSSS
jgi:hypothetical protein